MEDGDLGDKWRIAEPEGGYHFDPLSNRAIGAAIAVHKELGPGFREELYDNALCLEFDRRGVPYERQLDIPVRYHGVVVGTHTLDLLVEKALVVELKSVSMLLAVHYAQVEAYLGAADARVGLLLNFGAVPLGIKRLVNNYAG